MFTGSVSIYIAFSLQRVLHIPNAHSMFVTGLEFLPEHEIDGPPITSDTEAAVLSISVDNKVCIHSLSYRRRLKFYNLIVADINNNSPFTLFYRYDARMDSNFTYHRRVVSRIYFMFVHWIVECVFFANFFLLNYEITNAH